MRKAAYFCIALVCVFAMVGMASAQDTPWGLNVSGHVTHGGVNVVNATILVLCQVYPGPSVTLNTINTDVNGNYYWWGPRYVPAGNSVTLGIAGFQNGSARAVSTQFTMPDPMDIDGGQFSPAGVPAGWNYLSILGFPCRLQMSPPDLVLVP
jgi:hypothetical protein